MSVQVHNDRFMALEFTSGESMLGLRWKEATGDMRAEDFKVALVRYAEASNANGAANLLVDVRSFRWNGFQELEDWRVEKVVPLYNAAGVRKFAYLFPVGADLPSGTGGSPLKPGDKGEHFDTRYFGTEQDARAWFAEP